MMIEDVTSLLRAVPFQPFLIRMTNGSIYTITHPEMVMPLRLSLFVGVVASDLPPGRYDHGSIVSLMHISELIPIETMSRTQHENNGNP